MYIIETMATKKKVTVTQISKTKGVFIPKALIDDSSFPFDLEKDQLVMEIDGIYLKIRKYYPKMDKEL